MEQAALDAFERGKAFGFAEGMKSMRCDMNNEPVAWINKTGSHGYLEWDKDDEVDESIPLYTHPAELTDEEIMSVRTHPMTNIEFARGY